MPPGSTSTSTSASPTTWWRGAPARRSSAASASSPSASASASASGSGSTAAASPGPLDKFSDRERDKDRRDWVRDPERSRSRTRESAEYPDSDRERKQQRHHNYDNYEADGSHHNHRGHLHRRSHRHHRMDVDEVDDDDDVDLPPLTATQHLEPLPPPPPSLPALYSPTHPGGGDRHSHSLHSNHSHSPNRMYHHPSHGHGHPHAPPGQHALHSNPHAPHALAHPHHAGAPGQGNPGAHPYPSQLQPRRTMYEDQAQAQVQQQPPRSNPLELGLSATFVVTADEKALYVYVSESLADILGYEPHDLLGKSIYLIFHPDEKPRLREVHYQALTNEKVACVTYMRLLHQEGYYVECAVSYSTVYDRSVAMVTRAVDGPRQIQQAATAREVIEVSPGSQGRFNLRRWSVPSPTSSPVASPTSRPVVTPPSPTNVPWDLPRPSPRTFFLLDRFTDSARVRYVSNDVIVNAASLKNEPFFSIVKPSDRQRVRQWIDAAKNWTPVMYDEARTGGHGFTSFHVLKIPDLPPKGSSIPQGTDESERSMPGQEFIPVEAIFTASSDDVSCIINRVVPGASQS